MNAPENIDEQQSDDELSNHSRRFGGIMRISVTPIFVWSELAALAQS